MRRGANRNILYVCVYCHTFFVEVIQGQV